MCKIKYLYITDFRTQVHYSNTIKHIDKLLIIGWGEDSPGLCESYLKKGFVANALPNAVGATRNP